MLRKTLHRAGLATDGWDRLKLVLDGYVGAATALDPAQPGQSVSIDGAGNVVWTGLYTGGNLGDQFAAPPSPADDFNDEFNDGPDELGARGWTVVLSGNPSVPATYLGPVDYSINPFTDMALGTYRSSLRNGQMHVQTGSTGSIFVGKQFMGAAAFAAKAVYSYTIAGSITTTALVLVDVLSPGLGNVGNNGVICSTYETAYRLQTQQGTTTTSLVNQNGDSDIRQGTIFFLDWLNAGNAIHACQISASGGAQRYSFRDLVITGTYAPTWAGMNLSSRAVPCASYFAIDYIRKYPSGSWF